VAIHAITGWWCQCHVASSCLHAHLPIRIGSILRPVVGCPVPRHRTKRQMKVWGSCFPKQHRLRIRWIPCLRRFRSRYVHGVGDSSFPVHPVGSFFNDGTSQRGGVLFGLVVAFGSPLLIDVLVESSRGKNLFQAPISISCARRCSRRSLRSSLRC
jgi:hypothetical protein